MTMTRIPNFADVAFEPVAPSCRWRLQNHPRNSWLTPEGIPVKPVY